jgi:meso-butanediol dehydrogenase/(S,S)-butanediol dehydrogenase/diacetyl reductase
MAEEITGGSPDNAFIPKEAQPVPLVQGRHDGRSAFVTGAASGIGKASALRLAAEGAKVTAADLDEAGAKATVDAITEAGGTATAVGLNVGHREAVDAAIAAHVAAYGGLDLLANVAGVAGFSITGGDSDLAMWELMVTVNLSGSYYCARAAVEHLLASPTGAIVNIASNAGLMGIPHAAAYCSTKHGVVGLTKALSQEYLGKVRVNAIAPGGVDTALTASIQFPEGVNFKKFSRIMTPLGFATADEIGALLSYMGSEEARVMTGAIVTIDGGITA